MVTTKDLLRAELCCNRGADDADETRQNAHHGDNDGLGENLVPRADGETGVVGHVEDLSMWLSRSHT
jgi:hypothetical protein